MRLRRRWIPEGRFLYISKSADINNFSIFANSGWDGNWFVGSNTCWIQKLRLPENEGYVKAFAGAKLGRMKTEADPDTPHWINKALPGSIFIAVSEVPAWENDDCYFLADTKEIPFEGDPENAIYGTGESKWFWSEIPLSKLNFGREIYIAVYSNTPELNEVSNSPILAAAWGDKEPDTWMNDEINGQPPRKPETALKTAISYFKPAIAIKLIPENKHEIVVDISVQRIAGTAGDEIIISASIRGINIAKAWLEYSADKKRWEQHGSFIYQPPYQFSINSGNAPAGRYYIRVAARDEFINTGVSTPLEMRSERK